jgi:hypothetical protein
MDSIPREEVSVMYQTIKQFSQFENLPELTVRKLCRAGELPATLMGGAYQIDVEDAREWIRSHRVQPAVKMPVRHSKLPFLQMLDKSRREQLGLKEG